MSGYAFHLSGGEKVKSPLQNARNDKRENNPDNVRFEYGKCAYTVFRGDVPINTEKVGSALLALSG